MSPTIAAAPAVSSGQVCSRCGAGLAGRFCQVCGTEIYGPRLNRRGALGRALDTVAWHLGRFAATLLDLTVRPAQVAWVYLSGHRDRYLHPLPYLIFAIAAERLVYWGLLGWARLGRPAAALLIRPELWDRLPQLLAVLVVAVIWRVFFRRSGLNLFEMIAVAVYSYAHFVVLWSVFALVVGLLPIQGMSLIRWATLLEALLGLAVACSTGIGVFRENPAMTTLKILVASAVPFEVLAALDSILSHR